MYSKKDRMKTLEEMKEDYLKEHEIKYIGRRKKKKFKTNDLITYYSIHETQKVL